MVRIRGLVTGVVLVAAALPATLVAQGHPNIAVGLSPESTYDSSGIDNVSLFGGALSIGPIPLGPRYQVSSTLSYGLNALYNANRGGPRNSDRLLRWDPDSQRGVWDVPKEAKVPS